jgi:hypothetical protein
MDISVWRDAFQLAVDSVEVADGNADVLCVQDYLQMSECLSQKAHLSAQVRTRFFGAWLPSSKKRSRLIPLCIHRVGIVGSDQGSDEFCCQDSARNVQHAQQEVRERSLRFPRLVLVIFRSHAPFGCILYAGRNVVER